MGDDEEDEVGSAGKGEEREREIGLAGSVASIGITHGLHSAILNGMRTEEM